VKITVVGYEPNLAGETHDNPLESRSHILNHKDRNQNVLEVPFQHTI